MEKNSEEKSESNNGYDSIPEVELSLQQHRERAAAAHQHAEELVENFERDEDSLGIFARWRRKREVDNYHAVVRVLNAEVSRLESYLDFLYALEDVKNIDSILAEDDARRRETLRQKQEELTALQEEELRRQEEIVLIEHQILEYKDETEKVQAETARLREETAKLTDKH